MNVEKIYVDKLADVDKIIEIEIKKNYVNNINKNIINKILSK